MGAISFLTSSEDDQHNIATGSNFLCSKRVLSVAKFCEVANFSAAIEPRRCNRASLKWFIYKTLVTLKN